MRPPSGLGYFSEVDRVVPNAISAPPALRTVAAHNTLGAPSPARFHFCRGDHSHVPP